MIHAAPAFIGNAGMRSCVGRVPVVCCMARRTIQTKHARVEDRIGMARRTGSGQAFELTGVMALLTRQTHVPSRQWEIAAIVVKVRILPIGWIVTGSTIRSILTIVFIVRSMTGITITGRSLIYIVHVTLIAAHFGMSAFQLERRKVVIEIRRFPTVHRMADRTVRTELTAVRVVIVVAGIAILQSLLKVADGTRVSMAFRAGQPIVLASELEHEIVVGEIRYKAVHPVMTSQTV